jgi:hypothetical protein
MLTERKAEFSIVRRNVTKCQNIRASAGYEGAFTKFKSEFVIRKRDREECMSWQIATFQQSNLIILIKKLINKSIPRRSFFALI